MKEKSIYQFTDSNGTFSVKDADQDNQYYFPLANEAGYLAGITPTLGGDAKLDQHTFLTVPVSIEDLHMNGTARNFWFEISSGKKSDLWAVNGQSVWQKAGVYGKETCDVEAGLLWHKMTRKNPKLGVQAEVLSFVPVSVGTVEIMRVRIKNTSKKKLTLTPTSAIPLYARSADNLRDHRHVTSLLHDLKQMESGLFVFPTMTFNERGHKINEVAYFIVGADDKGNKPTGVYPTWDSFFGNGGSHDKPEALTKKKKPIDDFGSEYDGKEVMGALRFKKIVLAPGKSADYILTMGIDRGTPGELLKAVHDQCLSSQTVDRLFEENKAFWTDKNNLIQFKTGDSHFNQWSKWVVAQPTFRKIFGCSFLPDFDYGRGGRGWRDLWQDCLALLLAEPTDVRQMILSNFAGVRIDGSNATIIGRKAGAKKNQDGGFYWEPEFIADRNNVTRTWMDHGVWPYLTTKLYIDQTGDFDILQEKTTYFKDAQLRRAKKMDAEWLRQFEGGQNPPNALPDASGAPYQGTILERILVQTLVQFFNVGAHNNILLEDADWNDGMDMGHDKGESVAFTHLYGGNLRSIADLLELAKEKGRLSDVSVAKELLLLLDRVGNKVSYDSVQDKRARLTEYFDETEKGVQGELSSIPVSTLVQDLRAKADWIEKHVNEKEWVSVDGQSWFNGYYDNKGNRVEGEADGGFVKMTLTGQVFPIMAGTAPKDRVKKVVQAVNENLWDHELGSIRLNTKFPGIQPLLGRAFSFSYGEKENGAIFSHMVVMYANALYQRGLVEEGHRALSSLFRLAKNSPRSRIFPGLPEYFNNEGRGRYQYLTGSASWYVLTALTEVFGVRGFGGDLQLSPKLTLEQFDKKGNAEVVCPFAGARLKVRYENPEKLSFDESAIQNIYANGSEVPFSRKGPMAVVIQREILASSSEWEFRVVIGRQ